MKNLTAVLVVTLVLLSGCDGGSDRNASPNAFDRGREERSMTDSGATRDRDGVTPEARAVENGRQLGREKRQYFTSTLWLYSWWVVYYVVGVLVGLIIYRDAKARKRLAMNIRPIWWFLITIFDAPLGLLVYWLMNYSSLSNMPAGGEGKSDDRM